MQVVVVDLSSNVGRALKAMECALATAKATQRRAKLLLSEATASPTMLHTAEGIYVRSRARVKKLEWVLRLAARELEAKQ